MSFLFINKFISEDKHTNYKENNVTAS